MSLQFYNTKTRQKESFFPIKSNHVKIYTCGPTVYDTAHVGNFRTFIFEDLLKRYLLFKGFTVTHVMNLTDVDDKTIRKSFASGTSIRDLTDKYIKLFFSDLKTLKILPADHYPRATDHIAEMINMIKKLVKRGNAYKAEDGSIFFAINTYTDYGKLTRLNLSQQRSTGRVESDDYSKDSPQDFTLWKAWKPEDGDVFWDSPWGKGRPGWHIECSAMSIKYLGNHFDIHCGGVDNLFPHHENEIAQSVCATGTEFVNYWLHGEHLQLDSEKMSKSLGNFYRIGELLDAGFTPESLRYVLLSTHYRSKLKFSIDKHHEARKVVRRIQDIFIRLQEFTGVKQSEQLTSTLLPELTEFEKAMDNDLDVSQALGIFFEWIRSSNTKLDQGVFSEVEAAQGLVFLRRVNSLLDVLTNGKEIPDEILTLVQDRDAARKNQEWGKSDQLREKLKELGWVVEDSKSGTKIKSIP